MLIKFTKKVSLDEITRFTNRCESLAVNYKFIQERSVSYLVIESADQNKLDELHHQFRHIDSVERIILDEKDDSPLSRIARLKIKVGNRWIAHDHRPVIIAGSPYLESQKFALSMAETLASMGVNIYKAGKYRPKESLDPKTLYERSGAIISEIEKKAGIPSTGVVETISTKTALDNLSCTLIHLPGELMFETNTRNQLAKLKKPVLLERHPDASTALWLEMAGSIVADGNEQVILLDSGRNIGGQRVIDLVESSKILDSCPLPLIVNASSAGTSVGEVARISRGALGMGASGIMLDVHPNPTEGLLSDGTCLSTSEFEELVTYLKQLL